MTHSNQQLNRLQIPIRNHLQADLEMVLQRLSALLVLNTTFKPPPPPPTPGSHHQPHPTSSTVTSSHSSHRTGVGGRVVGDEEGGPQLCVEDQQFMFETAGILIIQSQFPPQVLNRCLLLIPLRTFTNDI